VVLFVPFVFKAWKKGWNLLLLAGIASMTPKLELLPAIPFSPWITLAVLAASVVFNVTQPLMRRLTRWLGFRSCPPAFSHFWCPLGFSSGVLTALRSGGLAEAVSLLSWITVKDSRRGAGCFAIGLGRLPWASRWRASPSPHQGGAHTP